jgi:hypothetical protein
VKLDLMMLANYAEAASTQLLYVAGGGWDTITVQGRAEDAPPEIFAVIQGHLVIKLLFHVTETDREHEFALNIMDDDGAEIASMAQRFAVPRNRDLPPGWLQNVNIVVPLTGMPLPHAGNYVVNLTVNGQWVGDRVFRVVDATGS